MSSEFSGRGMKTRRSNMVSNLERELDFIDHRVLEAMEVVPRHLFVDSALADRAYEFNTLPIGAGQTISSPVTVALVSSALMIVGGERVLEIGTGSGYQAAVLAELGAKVYSVEVLPALAKSARKNLYEAGYAGVGIRIGDGSLGWSQFAPYDRIVITASAPAPPRILENQLIKDGIIVLPVGGQKGRQELYSGKKQDGDGVHYHTLGEVRFVPLKGKSGWR